MTLSGPDIKEESRIADVACAIKGMYGTLLTMWPDVSDSEARLLLRAGFDQAMREIGHKPRRDYIGS